MNESFISEITKKLKDERGVKDKELDADRKEKHMEEKFKPEEGAFGEASSELEGGNRNGGFQGAIPLQRKWKASQSQRWVEECGACPIPATSCLPHSQAG